MLGKGHLGSTFSNNIGSGYESAVKAVEDYGNLEDHQTCFRVAYPILSEIRHRIAIENYSLAETEFVRFKISLMHTRTLLVT